MKRIAIIGGIVADRISGALFPDIIDPSFQGGGFRPPSGMSAEEAALFSGTESISGTGGSIQGPSGPTVTINFNGNVIADEPSLESFARDIMVQMDRIGEETLDI